MVKCFELNWYVLTYHKGRCSGIMEMASVVKLYLFRMDRVLAGRNQSIEAPLRYFCRHLHHRLSMESANERTFH